MFGSSPRFSSSYSDDEREFDSGGGSTKVGFVSFMGPRSRRKFYAHGRYDDTREIYGACLYESVGSAIAR